jgi:hypothetical protein
MAWYWIILIIIGYFVVGSVFAGLMTWVDEFDDDDLIPFMVFGWPLLVPILLIGLLCIYIIDFLRV